jgi:hypothetical protein
MEKAALHEIAGKNKRSVSSFERKIDIPLYLVAHFYSQSLSSSSFPNAKSAIIQNRNEAFPSRRKKRPP